MKHALNHSAAAAGLALGVVLVATACTSPSTTPPASVRTSAASTSPTSSDAGPRSMEGLEGALEPGPWIVPVYAADPGPLPRPVVQIPAGYGTPGGWVIDRGADGDPQNYGNVSFWTVDKVFSDPCQGTADVEAGTTVDDLAAILERLPVKHTEPTPVTLDGRSGKYLELTLPGRKALGGCTDDVYSLWQSDNDYDLGGGMPGTVFRLFVLDVDGHRVVVETDATPHETDADVAELLGIVRSTHFLPPER